MSENIPSVPGGALPPKPAEAAKVQPKKETVRINLPPKPTSAPTIKLPALAPGGPPSSAGAAAPVAAPAAPRAASPPTAAPVAAAPVAAAPPSRTGASATARQPAAPVPTQRQAPYVAPQAGLGKLDKALAIAAMILVLAAVGSTLWLFQFNGIENILPVQ